MKEMATETERKYLVDKKKWQSLSKPKGQFYRQGYLTMEPEKTIRVRITDTNSYLTIKGKSTGASRKEYEYKIPRDDAEELLNNFASSSIEKIRYKIEFGNKLWEVDEFKGENEGLIMAEIELKKENENFKIPGWVSQEVTKDERYYNVYLAQHPFKEWQKTEDEIADSKVPASILKEIAEYLEGGMSCFLHKKNFEIVSIPDERRFLEMDWDDEDGDWASDIKRVRSDPDFIEIESMESSGSYSIMEDFVNSLPESTLKIQLETAIQGYKPFANFNGLIHNAGNEKEQWFKFRTLKMMEWVKEQLDDVI